MLGGQPTVARVIGTLLATVVISGSITAIASSGRDGAPYVAAASTVVTKLLVGDWDRGFAWTGTDIVFLVLVGATAYGTSLLSDAIEATIET
jgi:hypothetical protein